MTLPLNTNNFPDPGGHVFTGLEACECSDDVMRTESLRSIENDGDGFGSLEEADDGEQTSAPEPEPELKPEPTPASYGKFSVIFGWQTS